MLITITEMGERKYSVDFWQGERRRHRNLMPTLYGCIARRATLLWEMDGFGNGRCGQQKQYVKGGVPWTD